MRGFFIKYFSELKKALELISFDKLEEINKIILSALYQEKKIFTMGNGGSGSTASHFICDLNKSVICSSLKKYKAYCLNDNIPTILAYANDLSFSDIFVEQLKNFMEKKDIVIGFSGRGNSENVLKAIDYANNNGGITIGFSGFDGGKLAEISNHSLVVPIKDMQKCEDIHLILCHLIIQSINNILSIKNK